MKLYRIGYQTRYRKAGVAHVAATTSESARMMVLQVHQALSIEYATEVGTVLVAGRYEYVQCSKCGQQFHFPEGRDSGFSHCDTHATFEPLSEDEEVYL